MGTGQPTYPVNLSDTDKVVSTSAGVADAGKLIKLDAAGRLGTGLAPTTPSGDNDVASKVYVDTSISTIPPLVLLDTTQYSVSAGTGGTYATIHTYTIPANTLTASNAIRITASGVVNTTDGSMQTRLYIGTTEVAQSTNSGNTRDGTWRLECLIVGNGATNSQRVTSIGAMTNQDNSSAVRIIDTTLTQDATASISVLVQVTSTDADAGTGGINTFMIEKID
jgi:hypothetical protein